MAADKFYALAVGLLIAGVCRDAAAQQPAPADVPLRQLADAQGWKIGAAVAAGPLRDDAAYRQTLAREFNLVTPENAMKFGLVQPTPDRYTFEEADAIVAFAQANRMQVRGHTLVWHQQLPDWVRQGQRTREEWAALLKAHIQTEVGRYKGKIAQWDVVNEAVEEDGSLRRTVWLDNLGPDYIDQAFRWAHEADPGALLFYNDYNGEGSGKKAEGIYRLVKGLRERGVPIDGIGLQMHVSLDPRPSAADLTANIQRLAALGLQVAVTEIDVALKLPATPELLAAQAERYRDIFDACRANPACRTFVLWGFTDRHSWIPHEQKGSGAALIFDEQYAPKPAARALMQALQATPAAR